MKSSPTKSLSAVLAVALILLRDGYACGAASNRLSVTKEPTRLRVPNGENATATVSPVSMSTSTLAAQISTKTAHSPLPVTRRRTVLARPTTFASTTLETTSAAVVSVVAITAPPPSTSTMTTRRRTTTEEVFVPLATPDLSQTTATTTPMAVPTTTPPRSTTRTAVKAPRERVRTQVRQREDTGAKLFPRDCADVQSYRLGAANGAYTVYRPGCLKANSCSLSVNCDLTTDGGGWTVLQQRRDGTVNFSRNWQDYRNGFGNEENFWIGNEYFYEVTNMGRGRQELLVQLTDFSGKVRFAIYDSVVVASEAQNYTLSLGVLFGSDSVDNLHESRDAPFVTADAMQAGADCMDTAISGWWRKGNCMASSDLNLPYAVDSRNGYPGLSWWTDAGRTRIRRVQMKIRPWDFEQMILTTNQRLHLIRSPRRWRFSRSLR